MEKKLKIIRGLSFRVFIIIFSIIGIICLTKGYQLFTHGFRIDKVFVNLDDFYHWNVVTTAEDEAKALKIFDQKFYYLDKGCQAYVFQSEDKKYVLKLMRYHRYKLPFWMEFITFTRKGEAYYKNRCDHRQKAFYNTMRSYLIANNHLKEDTGSIYLHLNKTNHLLKKVEIVDKARKSFYLDLDGSGFLLQGKVRTLPSVMKEFVKNKDEEMVKKTILSFLNMVDRMMRQKIVNKDYNCVKNSGYFDKRVIGMDLGSYFWDENLENPNTYEDEMNKFLKYFNRWFFKNSRNFLPFIEKNKTKLINEYKKDRKIYCP
jgi:hypothetical protein